MHYQLISQAFKMQSIIFKWNIVISLLKKAFTRPYRHYFQRDLLKEISKFYGIEFKRMDH